MKQGDIIREIDRLAKKLALNQAYAPINLAQSIVGVQPMTGPVGKIFTMQASYKPQPKYKFSRANWYVAEFSWVRREEVLEWCTQQFGPHPERPDAWSRWQNKYQEKIHFRDAKDYEWFILRWS